MKTGEIIYAKTHADFLNQAFGTNYKAWMKSCWDYNGVWTVWMVRFNRTDGGWRNTFVSDTRIKEENLYNVKEWDRQPVSTNVPKKRIVIQIEDFGHTRKYIFRGLYVYDEKNSNPYGVRYLDKVGEEIL